MAAAILANSDSLSVAAESKVSTNSFSLNIDNNSRMLKSPDTEERNIFEFADDVVKMATLKLWVNTGKTDDFVKEALGIEKQLTGAALKNHPKFKILDEFLEMLDAKKVAAWLNKDTPTAEVWVTLGLDKLTKEQLKESDGLRTYIRYATKLDDEIWNHRRASFEPEISSAAELAVKVQIWAKADRPSWYVFEMMGKNAMPGNPNREYYKIFQKLVAKRQHAKKLRLRQS
ncbi:unnamed protein product [Phytophthora fragariaefolia]|uniref:Unnamed protein product n=1 Tax=Phytophthora fragariaefolia TaxID=1490495 RepID=A0A9W6Y865_9STRA|nr:unnamed protein product [Phytophthora fragariaefolia]